MPEYTGTRDFTHGMPPRLGLLLVNLGTPDAPTTRAVRRYLAEFLSDPRVIEAPRALWWLALHGVVLRIRPRRSAAAYARIWTPQGSPLLVDSEALAQGLQRRLAVRFGDRVLVSLAMSYGLPSIGSALEHLRRQNVRRLLVLPLYPQYSGTTTASVFARVTAELARWRWIPELRFVNDYHDEEAYLAAVADSVAEHWRLHGRKHLQRFRRIFRPVFQLRHLAELSALERVEAQIFLRQFFKALGLVQVAPFGLQHAQAFVFVSALPRSVFQITLRFINSKIIGRIEA